MGRPPKWTDVDALQAAIDKYFEDCKGHPCVDENGDIVYGKDGLPVIVDAEPPTVTGLALALGFSTRLGLLNYQGKAAFMNTVSRAKARVEKYAERRLYDRDGARGAEFSLKYNFKWAQEEQDAKNAAAQGVVILPAIIEQGEDKADG